MPRLRHTPAERLRIRQWLQRNDKRLSLLVDPRPSNVARLLWKDEGLRIDPTQLGKLAWFYLNSEAFDPPILNLWRPNLRPLPTLTHFHGDLLIRLQQEIRLFDEARTMEADTLARRIERAGGPLVSPDAVIEARRLMTWPEEKTI